MDCKRLISWLIVAAAFLFTPVLADRASAESGCHRCGGSAAIANPNR